MYKELTFTLFVLFVYFFCCNENHSLV